MCGHLKAIEHWLLHKHLLSWIGGDLANRNTISLRSRHQLLIENARPFLLRNC